MYCFDYLRLACDLAHKMSTSDALSGSLDAGSVRGINRLWKDAFGAASVVAQLTARVPEFLPSPPCERLIVIGAGVPSVAMDKATEDNWSGPLKGFKLYLGAFANGPLKLEQAFAFRLDRNAIIPSDSANVASPQPEWAERKM